MELLKQQMQSLVAQYGFYVVLRALYDARPSSVSQHVRACLMEAMVKGAHDDG